MTAFHSDEAFVMLERLPKIDREPFVPNAKTIAFREFREQLVREGWFERSTLQEAQVLLTWVFNFCLGVAALKVSIPVGILILSVAQVTGGFLSHDYVHGRGEWCSFMRNCGCITVGLSPKWWSDKHNKHHAATNVMGVDEDIMVDPAIWLWAPDSSRDAPWRKYQHFYFPLVYAITFFLWRYDSIKTVLKEKLWGEGLALTVHYALFLAIFGPAQLFAQVAFGGILLAAIVTCTHQSEELFETMDLSFVELQFRSTRDAVCTNPLSEYIWGGMQYQLEHHLFPTMPRYKYPALVPLLKEFAQKNELEYRATDEFQIVSDNIKTYRRVASLAPVQGACPSR